MDERQFEVITDDEIADATMRMGLLYADAFVNKNYLIDLHDYPVALMDDDFRSDSTIRLFEVGRIVYDVDEIANDKLISVYSSIGNVGASAVLVLKGTEEGLRFYVGVRSERNAPTAQILLERSLKGNFPGSDVTLVSQKDLCSVLGDINKRNRFGATRNVASVSIVPSMRDQDKKRNVQGIEKLIDTMKGMAYTAMFLADPLGKDVLERRKAGLEQLYSSLSPFAQLQLSYGQNASRAIAQSMSENFSKTLNNSISNTNSQFESTSNTTSKGYSFGIFGFGFNRSTSSGFSSGSSWANAVTEGTSDTTGSSTSSSDTVTTGDSRSITVTSEDKSVKTVLERIDDNLKRIRNCESFGLWDMACYFISDDVQTAVMGASTYKALMAGYDSAVEDSYVNVWDADNDDDSTSRVLEYLRYCRHPRFQVPPSYDEVKVDEQLVTPCSLISGNEIPYIMGLPKHSVPGVTVLDMAAFGRNVRYSSNVVNRSKRYVEFGNVFHMGERESTRIRLDLESFRSHAFITGSTGSGKSNTTYRILDEMIRNEVPFLVIEPAKGEYKRYYGNLPGINIYCTNPRYFSMLRINPFRFDPKIHVLEHLDRLIEIFNACWPLYAAMPAILKEAFERAYIACGWDLNRSIRIPNGSEKRFPTFADVLEALPRIINSSAYSSDSKGDYTGALVTRVKSLTNGISGQVLCSDDDIVDEDMFDRNTIVDLSRVSSLETKSLIMGVMILKLNEYRMCQGGENKELSHVTVLEEAHNILKKAPEGGAEGANVQAKSVEMIGSAIAEMRTYGEGFIIVDQSPTAVDISAIKNTNTKIIMRLPDHDDEILAGHSLGLNDSQIKEVSRFPIGVAAVYQNNWVEAVLVNIDKSKERYHRDDVVSKPEESAVVKGKVISEIINEFESGIAAEDGFQFEDEMLPLIQRSRLNEYKKRELIGNVYDFCSYFDPRLDRIASRPAVARQLRVLMECDGLFEAVPLNIGTYEVNQLEHNGVSKEDLRKLRNWFSVVVRNLPSYVEFRDERTARHALRYVLLARRNAESNSRETRFRTIYTGLFKQPLVNEKGGAR
ncbi:ATP-binding protein [Bifidobacterium jacchi]|uniref:DUF87 domain-containing protein n=1 Tax=Bifidobacterium jacchi TaxID=2490545 RepID=A0A5N5RCY3_9BIFI|nr:DUF87 domain-containing protein [Bifidobacterium jacchi]KAB5604756.1 DUF87 domain-containing protein [Bifidobacterium jacchi]